MSTIVENISALTVGTVESVFPNEIKVLLELDAPQATALNTGIPSGFPRINGYVLIPNEIGAVVGIISWLGIERSAFPKRTGYKDFGLIDLPFPLRKLSLTPVGTLVSVREKETNEYKFRLERGVSTFPSVGDPVLLPTHEQLRSIVESHGVDRRIRIGTSPLAGDSIVSVDPDKLFGRHLAVLGNTGSGKSCSVAGLIRWSLEEAIKIRNQIGKSNTVNARFIILDPNGEYYSTFQDLGQNVRIFRVPPIEAPIKPLIVPAWMWNLNEWSAFASAAPAIQRPLLLDAIREMRAGAAIREPIVNQVSRNIRFYKTRIEQMIAQGTYAGFPQSINCGNVLRNLSTDSGSYASQTTGLLSTSLSSLGSRADTVAKQHFFKTQAGDERYKDFSEKELRDVLVEINSVTQSLPPIDVPSGPSADSPLEFDIEQLADHLHQLATDAGFAQAANFISGLILRIRSMLADTRLRPIVKPDASVKMTFEQWLNDYIGADGATNGQITVLDLSLVSPNVIHIVIAVIARIVFEALQRFRKMKTVELPTVLVLEEAHTFIHRGGERDIDQTFATPDHMCRQTFERIAREGRKFGLGLVLSSQRPSELSATVLAQCNTFLLHRIVNDRDQELVGKLVPDTIGGLLRELPSLPTMQAILVGWATPIPILVEMKYLPEEQRPRSADPKFWNVWTGVEERKIDWSAIAKDWTS